MQKMFAVRLSFIIIISMIITFCAGFFVQSKSIKNKVIENSIVKFEQVYATVEKNNEILESLRQSINEDYLTRARAFSYIIKETPEVLTNSEELENIKNMLNVDELHVTDENGILKWGTLPEYFEMDFSSSDQTKEFLPALTDKNFEFAQDAQLNGAEKKLFQYIGVSRIDQSGIVQVGMAPKRLQDAMEQNDLSVVLSQIPMDSGSTLWALNKTDNTIISHPNQQLLGKTISEVGFPNDYLTRFQNGGFYEYEGSNKFYIFKEYGDIVLGIGQNSSSLYSDRNSQLIFFSILLTIIFIIISLLVLGTVKNQVVNKINEIIISLEKISKGDYAIDIDIKGCHELKKLSSIVNDMVINLREKILQTNNLIKNQNQIISKIKETSNELGDYSKEVSEVSAQISIGVSDQSNSVEQLEKQSKYLIEQINSNAKIAEQASLGARGSQKKLEIGKQELKNMLSSIDKISSSANKIISDVKSLNSSGANADLSLLNNFSREIEASSKTASAVASIIQSVSLDANKASSIMHAISLEISKQCELMDKANNAVSKISKVTKENSETSQKIIIISEKLSEQIETLHSLIYENSQIKNIDEINY